VFQLHVHVYGLDLGVQLLGVMLLVLLIELVLELLVLAVLVVLIVLAVRVVLRKREFFHFVLLKLGRFLGDIVEVVEVLVVAEVPPLGLVIHLFDGAQLGTGTHDVDRVGRVDPVAVGRREGGTVLVLLHLLQLRALHELCDGPFELIVLVLQAVHLGEEFV